MTIKFIIMVNKQGQTRLADYYEYLPIAERAASEAEIVRKCLARSNRQVCVISARGTCYKVSMSVLNRVCTLVSFVCLISVSIL